MTPFIHFIEEVERYRLDAPIINYDDYRTHCNGCGSKGGVKFPDTMWGVDIEAACNIHDIGWARAKTYEDLVEANEVFDNNLKKIVDAESNSFTVWFRRMRVAKYVSAVELKGTDTYAKENNLMKRG